MSSFFCDVETSVATPLTLRTLDRPRGASLFGGATSGSSSFAFRPPPLLGCGDAEGAASPLTLRSSKSLAACAPISTRVQFERSPLRREQLNWRTT